MKKLFNLKTLMVVALTLCLAACKNPTTDIKVTVDMNIMKYSALLRVTDNSASKLPITGTTVTITGAAAASIYEISGKKNFAVKDGIITLGLDPAFNIAGGSAAFSAVISAPGYKTVTLPISFTNGIMQQSLNVQLAPTASAETGGTYTPPVPVKTSTRFVLDFTGTCTNKTNITVRPSLYLFFRESGVGQYVQLGFMDNGHIETEYLALGKKYDFQITYAGESKLVTQTIDVTSLNLTFALGESICNSF